jgi:YD repeat-containing protein
VADWDSDLDAVAENGNVTSVGTNGGTSYYGTYDQLGNVSEWIDLNQTSSGARAFGGHWSSTSMPTSSNISESRDAATGFDIVGFRVCCADTLSSPIVANNNIFLPVGNAGNASYYSPTELGWIGGVAYAYRIQRYEVSNAEYAAFLNAVAATDTYNLYNTNMGTNARGGITRSGASGSFTYAVKDNMSNKPVNFVTFYSALRYANWLHNNTPTGLQDSSSTEDGVYTFSAATTITAWRKTGMKYWLPTSHEWAKAAYYDPGKADNWWIYATRYASAPTVLSGATATGDGITA